MNISWEMFRFPFDDERWQNKALVGGLLGLAGLILWPLMWLFMLPISGYSVRIMRRAMKGEPPSLPEWDDWGQLFGDGLRVWVVGFVYNLPALLLMCCAYACWFLAMPIMAAAGEDAPGVALAAMFTSYGVGFVLFGVTMLVSLFLGFLSMVATTRMVAHGSLEAAFQFREVWGLARQGFTNYLLAVGLLYAVGMVASMVSTVLIYTCVLACLYPFLMGFLMFYGAALMGALLGSAYYHTVPPIERDLIAAKSGV